MFDSRGNKTFQALDTTIRQIGPYGKTKTYKHPSGWIRYGLNVLGKYCEGDKWLHPSGDPGNWYRAFHGTSRDFGASIYYTGFRISNGKNGTAAAYGPGVYCSPDVSVAEAYAHGKMVTIPTIYGSKAFKFVFQVCVNPSTINSTRRHGAPDNYWIAPTSADIRAYGILIKEHIMPQVVHQPPPQPQPVPVPVPQPTYQQHAQQSGYHPPQQSVYHQPIQPRLNSLQRGALQKFKEVTGHSINPSALTQQQLNGLGQNYANYLSQKKKIEQMRKKYGHNQFLG
eukprot:130134_1